MTECGFVAPHCGHFSADFAIFCPQVVHSTKDIVYPFFLTYESQDERTSHNALTLLRNQCDERIYDEVVTSCPVRRDVETIIKSENCITRERAPFTWVGGGNALWVFMANLFKVDSSSNISLPHRIYVCNTRTNNAQSS